MIKSSSFGFEFKESRRRWDCGKENRSEWTYEGRRKVCAGDWILSGSMEAENPGFPAGSVETDGSSTCYKGSAYRKLYAELKEKLFYFSGGIAKAALLSQAWDEGAFFINAVNVDKLCGRRRNIYKDLRLKAKRRSGFLFHREEALRSRPKQRKYQKDPYMIR